MTTKDRILLTCAIALSGFGISLIGSSPAARKSPVTLLFTSITLYLSEAVLFVMFFAGLWLLIKQIVKSRWIEHDTDFGMLFPNVGESTLRRFAFFEIVFVAVWSIAFKGVLYTTLNPAYSTYLMAKSQSLGIAIPAELIILVLVLVGIAHFTLRKRVINSPDQAS